MVLTNLVLSIPSNEAFIKLTINSDYSFHKSYRQTLLLFAIFALVASSINGNNYFRFQETSCVKYKHCVG